MQPPLASTHAAALCAGLLLALLPPAGSAQTQAEAIAFLQGSFTEAARVTVSCAEMAVHRSTRDDRPTLYVGLQFDPRAVTMLPNEAPGYLNTVVIQCITGACLLQGYAPGRFDRIGAVVSFTNGIEPARVVRAFQFFQKSCGGPYRSSF